MVREVQRMEPSLLPMHHGSWFVFIVCLLFFSDAQAESGNNANAANYNSNASYDVGLWQVNTVNWSAWYDVFDRNLVVDLIDSPSLSNGGKAPCDPNENLQCAIAVWKWGGDSFRLWSTCGGCGCC